MFEHAEPRLIAITGHAERARQFRSLLKEALGLKPDAVIYRERQLPLHDWHLHWQVARELCQQAQVPLIVARTAAVGREFAATGLHLSAAQLLACRQRPDFAVVGASCHSLAELLRAQTLACDYALLSPVLPPLSHASDRPALGMEGLAQTIAQLRASERRQGDGREQMRVYALGGMDVRHLQQVRACGASGIASISAFWRPQ